MALTWAESGTAATQDTTFYDLIIGTAASDGTTTYYGGRSLKLSGGSNSAAVKNDACGSSGRLTVWVECTNSNATSNDLISLHNVSVGNIVFTLRRRSTNVLEITNNSGSPTVSGGSLASSLFVRLCVVWQITTSTNFSIKVFSSTVDGQTESTPIISASNADFTLGFTSPTILKLNSVDTGSVYFSPIVIDDSSALTDMGDVRVTAKLPNATGNANNYSTAIGSATNRWDYVDERPLSTAKGWEEIGTTAVEESYGIQNAATGDVDLTGQTIVGYMPWMYGKRSVFAATTTTSVQSSTKATTTALPSMNVTSGDWCVVAIADQILGTAVTVAKTAGTSTIGSITQLSGPSTSTVRLTKWYFNVTGTGTLTLTFTHDNSASKRAGVLAAWPSISASPLDIDATNTTDGTSTYAGPASGTLAQANELVVGLFAFAGPSGDTLAVVGSTDSVVVSNGTTGGSAGGNSTLYMISRPVEATTTVTQSMTDSTADRAGVQGIASFKMSAGGGAGSPKLVANGSDVAVVLASTNALFYSITTSATYPNAAGTVGQKSTGNLNDSFLYECGVLVIYTAPGDTTIGGFGNYYRNFIGGLRG